MARGTGPKTGAFDASSASSATEAQSQQLIGSLEQLGADRQSRKRPSIVLGALLTLFVSSAGGIALAAVLMTTKLDGANGESGAEAEADCLSRDLVLFASVLSLLYIVLHIRGARTDYRRVGRAPPQFYGNYLHASALIVERLSIAAWVAALVATIVLAARASPFLGLMGKVPFLNLVICTGAIPSFIVIAVTIERNPTPFATTAFSRASFLTCRVSEFADDLAADMSVSRRASLQRKHSDTGSGSVLTVPTEEIFRLRTSGEKSTGTKQTILQTGDDARTELMASSPMRESHDTGIGQKAGVPSIPKVPDVPRPVYVVPGGWRAEWNNVAQEVGVSQLAPNSSADGSNIANSDAHRTQLSPSSSLYSSTFQSRASSPSTAATDLTARSKYQAPFKHPATATTSIASSAARSSLSAVRYASNPDVVVRQSMQHINTGLLQTRAPEPQNEISVTKPPDPVALLRMAQKAQKESNEPPRKKSSNFSRPLLWKRGSDSSSDFPGRANEDVNAMRVPGAYVEEDTQTGR